MERKRHKTRYPGIMYRLEDESKPDGPRRYIVWYSDAQGTGHTKTLPRGASLEDARLLQGSLQARKADGETLVRTRLTVAELLDTMEPEAKERYAYSISVLKDRIGQRKAVDLSASDVARMIRELKAEGKKTWTVKKILTPLRGVYRVAVRDGMVASSPVEKLLPNEKPKGDQREMRCMGREEIERLLACTESYRWRTLFATLVFTGLRISEALNLTWDDITEEGVVVRRGKTESAKRTVMLIPALRKRLAAHRLKQAPGATFVFGTLEDRPCGRREALRALRVAERKAKLPEYTLHELRHTFASILIANGENVVLVAKQMGHADPGVTLKTYAHLFEAQESVEAARERLQATMGGMA